ncbi:uncharacterized protein LOC113312539 [Papaver somniferum]|uniref:uncharacterized protein LOC113312539 n=1 Tax=Papaver somniferum TaxID=3469 RepID=UPI000E6F96F5|nr:uncharacterized protein LOC113312539 [Papaver somniferum]
MLLAPFKFPNMRFLQPIGLSGGLALLWKNGFICDVLSCEDNMIHVAVQCDPSQPELLLSCMYGYCDYSKKKVQWEFIKDIGLNIAQPWVFLGDLNFHILDSYSSASSSGDGFVNSIIQEVGLQGLGFIGREHTWSNNNLETGKKRSRLDMAPMTWLQDRTCAAEIAKAWEKSVQGSPGFKLIKRLQFTKITLSKWNKTHFGNIDQNHFKNISTSQTTIIEEQYYSHIPTLITEEDNNLLLLPPTDEEILKVLKSMESWSAPGPEGFQSGFYKSQ